MIARGMISRIMIRVAGLPCIMSILPDLVHPVLSDNQKLVSVIDFD